MTKFALAPISSLLELSRFKQSVLLAKYGFFCLVRGGIEPPLLPSAACRLEDALLSCAP